MNHPLFTAVNPDDVNPEPQPGDFGPLEPPANITIAKTDLVAAWVGDLPQPCFGTVTDTCLNNFADNGRNWYKVDFGDFTLWLTDEDENAALQLVFKGAAALDDGWR